MSNPVSLIRNVDLTLLFATSEWDYPFSVEVGVWISMCNTNLSRACNTAESITWVFTRRLGGHHGSNLHLASLTSHWMQIIFWHDLKWATDDTYFICCPSFAMVTWYRLFGMRWDFKFTWHWRWDYFAGKRKIDWDKTILGKICSKNC